MPERKKIYSDGIVTCPKCQKQYKIFFRNVHYPGAGSAADWLHIHLPCKHETEEVYDDNRASVNKIEEI